MKKVLVSGLLLLGVVFAYSPAYNWTPANLTVTNSTFVVAPFSRTGYAIRNQTANTVNVVMQKLEQIATDNVLPYQSVDYIGLTWGKNETLTLNASTLTSANIMLFTYEMN